MKGLFIPDITAEMFRGGCLEGIEALMAEGEIYDIEYDPKCAEPDSKELSSTHKALDTISRQAAIDEVVTWTVEDRPDIEMPTDLVGRINALPSAQPERKKGKWLEKEVIRLDDLEAKDIITEWQSAKCNVCGKYHTTPYMYYFSDYDYCPNCGSYNGENANEG